MSSRYRTQFPQKHTVLPVVHVTSLEQALRNVGIARKAGADGVFLIGHEMPWHELLPIHTLVKREFGELFVGVNFLDLRADQAFKSVSSRVGAIWSEDTPKFSSTIGPLVFGGVAFKYQKQPKDVAQEAKRASHYMDVVVTSGVGTGKAPDVAKIKTMKEALGDFPLAIASGITTKNIVDFLPYADCFMVATGISSSEDELDPGMTDLLVRMVREYKA